MVSGAIFLAAIVAVVLIIAFGRRRSLASRIEPEQTVEPPGETSPPDDWPRDGGDNPRAP